jgi:enamine deaminase RidA (YjgF/YER057c/UK114 family)
MTLQRFDTSRRISSAVVHGKTVYLSGQVGIPGHAVREQTQEVLAQIDSLLANVGSHKGNILQAIIWLADIADFDTMNAVWEAWVPEGHAPARATSECQLASPDYKVEITVVAALD